MQLALATGRLPSEWLREHPTDTLTAITLLDEQAEDMERRRGH